MKCRACKSDRKTGCPFCSRCLMLLPVDSRTKVINAQRCRTAAEFRTIEMATAQIESELQLDARLDALTKGQCPSIVTSVATTATVTHKDGSKSE